MHAATRADLARLGSLAEQANRLGREANEARAEADEGPTAVRRLAADAAMAGTALDAAEVAWIVRKRQEAADAAQAVAEDTRGAMEQVRREVVDGIAERRSEWLVYLHGQAAHGLARLELVLSETGGSHGEPGRDRPGTADRGAPASRLFSTGWMIAGNAVEVGKAKTAA
ncbi:hypothetical protein ACWEH1_20610 [Micromonospora chersina]